MRIARIRALVILVVAFASAAFAQDYIPPDDVTILTEEELLTKIIGNTNSGELMTERHGLSTTLREKTNKEESLAREKTTTAERGKLRDR